MIADEPAPSRKGRPPRARQRTSRHKKIRHGRNALQASPAQDPSKLKRSGFAPESHDACIAEAAAERGMSASEAELFAQEAWAEMEE